MKATTVIGGGVLVDLFAGTAGLLPVLVLTLVAAVLFWPNREPYERARGLLRAARRRP